MIFGPAERKKKVVLVEEVALVKESEAGREREKQHEREEEKGIDGVVMVLAGEDGGGEGGGESYAPLGLVRVRETERSEEGER
jgi:hypothetical protein